MILWILDLIIVKYSWCELIVKISVLRFLMSVQKSKSKLVLKISELLDLKSVQKSSIYIS